MVLARVMREGGSQCLMHTVSFLEDEKNSGTDGGDGCTM